MVGETVRAKLVNLFDGGGATKENQENRRLPYKYQYTRFASGGSSEAADRDWFLRGEDRSQSPPLAIYTDEDVVRKALGTSTLDQDTRHTSLTVSSAAHMRSRTSSSSFPPDGVKISSPPSPDALSSEPGRYSLDLSTLKPSRFHKGTFNMEDLRSCSSSSSWNFSSRHPSKESHHESVTEAIEAKTAWEQELDPPPPVGQLFSTVRSGNSSYKTCNEGKLPPRRPLTHLFTHLSEASGASDSASLKPLRSRHPTDTNPLTESSESLTHLSLGPSAATITTQPVQGADGAAEEAPSKKKSQFPKRRPKPLLYFKRAREAIHVRRRRISTWIAFRFKHAPGERGRSDSRGRRPRIPPRSSSVVVTRRRKNRQGKDAPLLRARSMFAIGSLVNHSDSTISLFDDELCAVAPRPTRASQSKDRGRMSMRSLNKKLSSLSFSSTRTRRRQKVEKTPLEV